MNVEFHIFEIESDVFVQKIAFEIIACRNVVRSPESCLSVVQKEYFVGCLKCQFCFVNRKDDTFLVFSGPFFQKNQIFYLKKKIKEVSEDVVVIGFSEHKEKLYLPEEKFIEI